MSALRWLKHAFAIDRGPVEPTPEQRAIVERICREIVRRRLSVPALAFLEMSRPLNSIGAQALHFLAPFISAVTDSEGHQRLAEFLEQRGSIDFLCARIEALEAQTSLKETEAADDRRD